jgi:hypothetical protein
LVPFFIFPVSLSILSGLLSSANSCLSLLPVLSCLFSLAYSFFPILSSLSLLPIFLPCLSYLSFFPVSLSYSLLLVLFNLSYLFSLPLTLLTLLLSFLHSSTLFQLLLFQLFLTRTFSYLHPCSPNTDPRTQCVQVEGVVSQAAKRAD